MYYAEADMPARVRTMNLNEDLGQVTVRHIRPCGRVYSPLALEGVLQEPVALLLLFSRHLDPLQVERWRFESAKPMSQDVTRRKMNLSCGARTTGKKEKTG